MLTLAVIVSRSLIAEDDCHKRERSQWIPAFSMRCAAPLRPNINHASTIYGASLVTGLAWLMLGLSGAAHRIEKAGIH